MCERKCEFSNGSPGFSQKKLTKRTKNSSTYFKRTLPLKRFKCPLAQVSFFLTTRKSRVSWRFLEVSGEPREKGKIRKRSGKLISTC